MAGDLAQRHLPCLAYLKPQVHIPDFEAGPMKESAWLRLEKMQSSLEALDPGRPNLWMRPTLQDWR